MERGGGGKGKSTQAKEALGRGTLRIETNLYATATPEGELVWTGISDSFNPSLAEKAGDAVVAVVVKDLEKEGIFGGASALGGRAAQRRLLPRPLITKWTEDPIPGCHRPHDRSSRRRCNRRLAARRRGILQPPRRLPRILPAAVFQPIVSEEFPVDILRFSQSISNQ